MSDTKKTDSEERTDLTTRAVLAEHRLADFAALLLQILGIEDRDPRTSIEIDRYWRVDPESGALWLRTGNSESRLDDPDLRRSRRLADAHSVVQRSRCVVVRCEGETVVLRADREVPESAS
jgi:hypothetical protein